MSNDNRPVLRVANDSDRESGPSKLIPALAYPISSLLERWCEVTSDLEQYGLSEQEAERVRAKVQAMADELKIYL